MASYLEHRRACAQKQADLHDTLACVPAFYTGPSTDADTKILALSLRQLVAACLDKSVAPSDVLEAYGKRALAAHAATNCLADVFLLEAERAASLLENDKSRFSSGPLAGVPVSIKDCIDIEGHDTTLGFSANAGKPAHASAPLVRLLRDAGALLYVKTALPTACLSFECSSDLFGATTNPYNPAFSPGASTGGGAALLAWQGSMIEVGTDIGGSTRYPSAFCGLYAVKGTSGRFPSSGCVSCTPGLEAVPTVTSPLARTLDDLEEFWSRVVEMRPWEYDHTCAPIPWSRVDYIGSGKKLKFGLIMDDGVIPPTPAAVRALSEVADALRRQGHEIVPFSPPSPLEGLEIGYQLMFSDGAASILEPRSSGEFVSPALLTVRLILRLPLWFKKLQATFLRWFSRPWGRNDSWASLVEIFHPRTALEERKLIVERAAYRQAWHDAWHREGFDLVLTVPHALPAIPKEPEASSKATLVAANYAFLYNVVRSIEPVSSPSAQTDSRIRLLAQLDCAAGVMPVTYVDRTQDSLPPDFRQGPAYTHMNDIARAVHDLYDADAMHGLPVGIQVVGGRYQEESVIAGMKLIEHILGIRAASDLSDFARQGSAGGRFVPRRF